MQVASLLLYFQELQQLYQFNTDLDECELVFQFIPLTFARVTQRVKTNDPISLLPNSSFLITLMSSVITDTAHGS